MNLRESLREKYDLGYYMYGNNLIGVREGASSLNNPQYDFDSIHVTGSKGSSSTSAFVHSVLCEEGYDVGLFSGTNVSNKGVREKFQINNNYISDTEFLSLANRVIQTVETRDEWDILVLMAITYFSENNVDIAIFESGVGGATDSTNILSADLCIITNAVKTPNHPELGQTDIGVAKNKSGIIHNGSIVTSNGITKVNKCIKNICLKRNAEYYHKKQIISFERQNVKYAAKYNDNTFETDILASYLCENINTALTGLINSKFNISDKSIISSTTNFNITGRLELIETDDYNLLLDCASNKLSANALKSNIKQFDNINNLIFTGIKKEDGWKEVIDELEHLFENIYVPKTDNDDLIDSDRIQKHVDNCTITDSIEESLNYVDKSDLTVVTGSLILISEVNRIINNT